MSFPLILFPFPLPLYLFAIYIVWLRCASLGKVIFRLSFILCYCMHCSLTDRPLLDNISSSYFHENFVSSAREELVIRANCLARVKLCHFWFRCVFKKLESDFYLLVFHTKVASLSYWSTLGKVFFLLSLYLFCNVWRSMQRNYRSFFRLRTSVWNLSMITLSSAMESRNVLIAFTMSKGPQHFGARFVLEFFAG